MPEGPVSLDGEVAAAQRASAGWRAGVRFRDVDTTAGDAIIRWCFRHPFGPDGPTADQPIAPSREPQITTPPPALSRLRHRDRSPASR
jgi:hypothetical protein